MRTQLLAVAAIAATIATPMSAQRGRRSSDSDRPGNSSRRDNNSSDERFTPSLRSGQRLSVSNIDGTVTVTQGRNSTAEIVAHKVVHKGNGDLVMAVLEETSNGYRVCTVYLNRSEAKHGCNENGRNHNGYERDEPLDVDMNYEIRLPSGVLLAVNTVDGDVDLRGIDAPSTIRTVDGDIKFEGVAPESMNTVDGSITATITDRDWNHSLSVRTVDGEVQLTLPASMSAKITGRTVDGAINSDFPVTVSGKWGPQSFRGDIGNGRGPSIDINTVDGSINLRSADGTRRSGDREDAPRRRGRGQN